MKQTVNYGLKKPGGEDYFNIEDFNGNTDIIDGKLKSNSDRVGVMEDNLYNPNLLYNSNFKVSELVNQRGTTTYSTNGYCIDGFIMSISYTASVDLTSEYLKLKNVNNTWFEFRQPVENLVDLSKETLTLSALVRSDTEGAYIGIGFKNAEVKGYYLKKDEWTLITVTSKTAKILSNYPYLLTNAGIVGANTIEIQYFKMEVGEVATKFVDDDPATKLVKCQRYLYKPKNKPLIRSSDYWSGGIGFLISFPTNMRVRPTFVNTPVEGVDFNVYSFTSGVVTGFNLAVDVFFGNYLNLHASKSAHGLTDAKLIFLTDILLSAEL